MLKGLEMQSDTRPLHIKVERTVKEILDNCDIFKAPVVYIARRTHYSLKENNYDLDKVGEEVAGYILRAELHHEFTKQEIYRALSTIGILEFTMAYFPNDVKWK